MTLTNQRPLSSTDSQGNKEFAILVQSVDANGNIVSGPGGGGGTQYAEGATTSPATGTVAEGRAVDPNSPPAYSLNQLRPVSLDLTGAILANIRNLTAARDTVSSVGNTGAGTADSGNPLKVGGVYNATLPTLVDGQRGNAQLSNRGELLMAAVDVITGPTAITAADSATSTSVGAEGQVLVTGNPTNNSTVTSAVGGNSSFSLEVLGTFTGTYVIERTLDPQNNNQTRWTSVGVFPAGLAVPKSTFTGPGNFHGNSSSATFVRVRFTALSSGTPSVRILAGQGTGTITVGNPLRLIDGTSLAQATIKPASTPAVATDTAIAVTIRDVAKPTPATIATPFSAVSITAVTAQTDLSPQKIDLNSLAHNGFFNIGIEIATNTTAPGASRTLTVFYAFSQNDLSSNIPTQLSTREYSKVCDLPNSTSVTREYETGRVDQTARYLYVWYDHSARDASSQLTLTVRLTAL